MTPLTMTVTQAGEVIFPESSKSVKDMPVTVAVDAQGTSVQGDSAKGKEFGRVISEAVKNEIVIQKRPPITCSNG